ncbi:hypothetical protein [Streptomyces sp. NPDC005407]|uniref:hypothetical protein n=1 Tax=Streptomyces sp. NPDC005407 TaxID=3155340 RepID=UPI0033ADF471
MTAYSFGNRWVGVQALNEPPGTPALQQMAQQRAGTNGRQKEPSAQPATSAKPAKRARWPHPSIDLGNGCRVNAPAVRAALRTLARDYRKCGRAEEAQQLTRLRDRLIEEDCVDIDDQLKRVLRQGFGYWS